MVDPSALISCAYDSFTVDITNGPSKGLHLSGKLLLVSDPPQTRLGGRLMNSDGQIIPVLGAYFGTSNDLSLTLQTKDGFVMGLGPKAMANCQGGGLKGVAIGPRISDSNDLSQSDTGNWVLSSPTRTTTPVIDPTNPTAGTTLGANGGYSTDVSTSGCSGGGGTGRLTCGFLCLFTYYVCAGGDHNGEVIID